MFDFSNTNLAAITGLGVYYLFITFLVAKIFKSNYVNPHSYFTLHQLVTFVFAPTIQIFFLENNYTTEGLVYMNAMLALWYLAFTIGFLTKSSGVVDIIHRCFGSFDLKVKSTFLVRIHVLLLGLIALGIFIVMAQKSGLGFINWLKNPREGYQDFRNGVGFFYVLSFSFFNLSFLITLYHFGKSRKKIIIITLLFATLSYFWGSKGGLIGIFFGSIVYYNYYCSRLSLKSILLLGSSLVGVFILLMWRHYKSLYDMDFDAVEILNYFNHYSNGYRFFNEFDQKFNYLFGEEYIDSLWKFVPRFLIPDKPQVYGVNKYVLFAFYGDSLDESGNGPAFGGPIEPYLNFGLLGVILDGFFNGLTNSIIYRYFLKYRNFIGLIFLLSITGFEVVTIFSNVFVIGIFYGIQALFIFFHRKAISP